MKLRGALQNKRRWFSLTTTEFRYFTENAGALLASTRVSEIVDVYDVDGTARFYVTTRTAFGLWTFLCAQARHVGTQGNVSSGVVGKLQGEGGTCVRHSRAVDAGAQERACEESVTLHRLRTPGEASLLGESAVLVLVACFTINSMCREIFSLGAASRSPIHPYVRPRAT